jgi:hypothetical protein
MQQESYHRTLPAALAQWLETLFKVVCNIIFMFFIFLKDWAGKKVTILYSKFLMVKSSEHF